MQKESESVLQFSGLTELRHVIVLSIITNWHILKIITAAFTRTARILYGIMFAAQISKMD